MAKKERELLMGRMKEWSKVVGALTFLGWRVVKDEKDKKILTLGNQRIVLLKFPKNKWKIIVYERNRLVDSSFGDEIWAKLHVFEIGMARSFRRI